MRCVGSTPIDLLIESSFLLCPRRHLLEACPVDSIAECLLDPCGLVRAVGLVLLAVEALCQTSSFLRMIIAS